MYLILSVSDEEKKRFIASSPSRLPLGETEGSSLESCTGFAAGTAGDVPSPTGAACA
jgi:hypothetical protein